MYAGEVNVLEEDLYIFLEIAEDLNVRGLSEGNMDRAIPSEGNISQITNQEIDQSPERIIEHKKVNKCFAGISRIKKETKTTIASTEIDEKMCPANKEQNIFSAS